MYGIHDLPFLPLPPLIFNSSIGSFESYGCLRRLLNKRIRSDYRMGYFTWCWECKRITSAFESLLYPIHKLIHRRPLLPKFEVFGCEVEINSVKKIPPLNWIVA